MNGKKIKHGFDYAKVNTEYSIIGNIHVKPMYFNGPLVVYQDYYPDLIANDSIAFLRQSKHQNQRKPIMLTMSFPSPHGPEDSAPQYSQLFFNVTTHQ